MKIYTKKGDDGTTGLLGGTRLMKHHIRIEAYGTIDELNSYLGLIRDQNIANNHKETLLKIQEYLFTIGAHLASDPDKNKMKLPELKSENLEELERSIDKMEESLPTMKNFVLPGGHTTVSYIHIARNVCRRAERRINELHEISPLQTAILKYANRLSDYLFVLSRALSQELSAEEIPWKPSL